MLPNHKGLYGGSGAVHEIRQNQHGRSTLEIDQRPLTDPLYLTALASLGSSVPALLKVQPTKDSIAVLPFANLSGDPAQEFFADGLTEDIITDLSNVPGFFVIARNSTFAYKGRPTDVRHIARDLGVRYVLEGSARRSDNRLRINVQLIDAADGGNHVWAERFDRDISAIFEVQDEVTRHIVEAISGKLKTPPATDRYRPSSLEAYELCVKSRELFAQSSLANLEAKARLEKAIAIDPDYAEAHWRLAIAQMFAWIYWGEAEEPLRKNALATAQKAVELDPNDLKARCALAYVLQHERRFDEAQAQYDVSLRMNPNDSDAHVMIADFVYMIGKPTEALELIATAFRLNPSPPGWYYWVLGYLQIVNGMYSEAVITLRREETYRSISRRNLAAALALLGRLDEAKEEASYFQQANPRWRISTWASIHRVPDSNSVEFWVTAFRLAGLPE